MFCVHTIRIIQCIGNELYNDLRVHEHMHGSWPPRRGHKLLNELWSYSGCEERPKRPRSLQEQPRVVQKHPKFRIYKSGFLGSHLPHRRGQKFQDVCWTNSSFRCFISAYVCMHVAFPYNLSSSKHDCCCTCWPRQSGQKFQAVILTPLASMMRMLWIWTYCAKLLGTFDPLVGANFRSDSRACAG